MIATSQVHSTSPCSTEYDKSVYMIDENHKLRFLLQILTKHVFWPQVDSPMHRYYRIWRKLQELVCRMKVVLKGETYVREVMIPK